MVDKPTRLLTLKKNGREDFNAKLDSNGFPGDTSIEKVDGLLSQAGAVTSESGCNNTCPIVLNQARAVSEMIGGCPSFPFGDCSPKN